ncbi:MAG TPA: glycosyltransferase family 2 protein [Anaerolineae bacterium]|nr:glycosyltransferase family 2 protein [Anaerolineae bacterium]
MNPKPIVSIIIVNWNTQKLLTDCLTTIAAARDEISLETIVVDNASTDDSVSLVRQQFPWVHLIANDENVGFARGNNQGIKVSQGAYILLLNSDTELKSGAVVSLVTCLQANPDAGAAGPLVRNSDGSIQNCYGDLPSVWLELIGPYLWDNISKPWGRWGPPLDKNKTLTVERVSFACTLISRTALDEVGLLDEQFGFYSEDYDWFYRLQAAGWQTLFCPQAEIFHHWGASSKMRNEWALKQLYKSKRIYFAKHYGSGTELILRLGLLTRFTAKAIINNFRHYLLRQSSINASLQWQLIRDMLKSP